ncbi:MAG: hypothetical protein Q4D81_09670 [Eubacteriales bacterium]|nr:hypothetical protein [Eubacteriales bacterium]
MNRFEAMLAPPTLSGKEMAMHVKMQKEVSRDEANAYRAEMLVPEVRLYDELTTLRFRRPGPDVQNTAYRKACSALSGATGTPIPYRFFKGEFDRLLDEIGVPEEARDSMSSFKPDQITEAVLDLEDPWRTQAYAALCARIAQSSETEDAKHAAAAWDMAFSLYDIFFKSAKVEESTTYKQQTEEKFKADTVAAWDGFRRKLAEEIVGRTKDYIRDSKPASVAACIDALGTPAVRAVDSDAVDRALSESLIPYVNALRSAKSLKEAAGLYEKIPEQLVEKDTRQECVRAMLSVLSDEVGRLQENENSVQTVLRWINKLEVENLYKKGTPLVKKAAGDFYEKCALYVRDVINGSKHKKAKYADNLVGMIPDDIVVASSGDGKELHREDVIGLCTTAKLRSEYDSKFKSVSSEYNAREMGKSVYQMINTCAMPGLPAARKRELTRHLCQNLLATLQQSEMRPNLQLAFLECFEDNQPIVDENLKTVGGYKRMLRGEGSVPVGRVHGLSEGMRALAEFAGASEGSGAQHEALRKVIEYALDHPDEDVSGDPFIKLAETCCRNAFIGALNKKNEVSDFAFNVDYKPIMELAASFLPAKYEFPAGSGKTMSMSLLESLLKLNIDTGLRRKADQARKKAGYGHGGGGGGSRVTPGYHAKVIAAAIKKVLPPFLFWLILTIIQRVSGGLPAPARFFRMLFQISTLFYIPIGIASGCLENKTPHPRLWKFVLLQAYLLCGPVTFYKILEFCNALPLKIWAIVLFVIYGIVYVLTTIASLISKD